MVLSLETRSARAILPISLRILADSSSERVCDFAIFCSGFIGLSWIESGSSSVAVVALMLLLVDLITIIVGAMARGLSFWEVEEAVLLFF